MAETFPNIPAHRESPGVDTTFNVLEATFGDGYIQASGDGLNAVKDTWNLAWVNEDMDDAVTVINFLKARGGWDPFYWQAPTEPSPRLWRCKSLKSNPSGPYAMTISAVFEQWNGPAS